VATPTKADKPSIVWGIARMASSDPEEVGSATMKAKIEGKRANKPLPMSQGSGFVHFAQKIRPVAHIRGDRNLHNYSPSTNFYSQKIFL
jgi:hypothetical protein